MFCFVFFFFFERYLSTWHSQRAMILSLEESHLNECFVMLAGQRTTPRTDRCTGRIIRLCTSAALDGPSLTGKPVVSTVSNHKCLPFPVFFFVKWKDIEHVDSGKRKTAFPKSLGGRIASNSISQLLLLPS